MPFAFQIPIPSLHLVLVFVAALATCAALTKVVLRHLSWFGLDHPDGGRKQHDAAVSRLGGLPIFLTLAAGVAYAPFGLQMGTAMYQEWWPILLCLALIFAIGFADDLKPLGARAKLLGQIIAACLLYLTGFSIDVLSHPMTGEQMTLGWLAFPATLFWLIAIPNVINLIDGMDGLAGGFGLFLCLTLGVIGHFSGMPDVVLMSAVMAGALCGFLFFNFPPAKIFLGDGGAYLIGFFIAALSLMSSHKGTIISALLVMVLALGVPILDTLFAIVRRGMRGLPIFSADAEHIHHRLIQLGYSKSQALLVLYTACALLSLIGITILLSRGLTVVVAGAALVILGLFAARYLGYVRSWRAIRKQVREAFMHRRTLEYVRAYGRVLELEALKMPTQEDFCRLLQATLQRTGFVADPKDAAHSITIPIMPGVIWTLGVSSPDANLNLARRQAGELAEAVNLAVERWETLPGLELTSPIPQMDNVVSGETTSSRS